MLLFDDSKKLEKALGEEAATVIAHVFEKMSDDQKRELATRADLENGLLAVRADLENGLLAVRVEMQTMRTDLVERISATENRLTKWMVGGFLAQTALLVAVLAFLTPLLQSS